MKFSVERVSASGSGTHYHQTVLADNMAIEDGCIEFTTDDGKDLVVFAQGFWASAVLVPNDT